MILGSRASLTLSASWLSGARESLYQDSHMSCFRHTEGGEKGRLLELLELQEKNIEVQGWERKEGEQSFSCMHAGK